MAACLKKLEIKSACDMHRKLTNSFLFVGGVMYLRASTFSGSGLMPSELMINPHILIRSY